MRHTIFGRNAFSSSSTQTQIARRSHGLYRPLALAFMLIAGTAVTGCSSDSSEEEPSASGGSGGSGGSAGEAGQGQAGKGQAGTAGSGQAGEEQGGAGGEGQAGQGQAGEEQGGAGGQGQAGGGDANDTGFRAAKDGFGFENYTNDTAKTNLTAEGVRSLFGDKVCGSMAGGACTLTPVAEQWRVRQNQGMNGGHCEGMATLSLLLYKKLNNLKPSDFGADTTPALKLDSNPALENEIAKWFSTQAVTPTANAEYGKQNSPKEVIDKLKEVWAAGETSTMGIYKPGYKDGHAITPYQIIDKGSGMLTVMVYDNNFPLAEREMTIDLNANKWSYSASTNPSEPEGLYEGDATTGTLTVTPTKARLSTQDCDFCSGGGESMGPLNGFNEVLLLGKADLLITDESGKKLGYEGGKFIHEIAGADFMPIKSKDLFTDDPEPIYQIPVNTAFTITLDGSELTAMDQSTVSLTGPGYVLEVEGITLAPMQKDTIKISKDSNELTYSTTSDETPTVNLGFESAGADYLLSINADGDPSGISVHLKLDQAKGEFSFQVVGSPSYTIVMSRVDDSGEAVFSHTGEENVSTDTTIVPYGMWGGNGKPLMLQIDHNSDGTIDDTVMADDQN